MVGHPEFHRVVLEQMLDAVYFLDPERRVVFWSRGAEQLTGYSAQEVQGRCCADNVLIHVDHQGRRLCQHRCPVAETLQDLQPRETEVILHHRDGHRVPVLVRVAPVRGDDGRILGVLEVFSDNRAAIAARQQLALLRKELLLDPLTQMGNRRYLQMGVESRLFELRRFALPFGVLLMDVDHFKRINDTHGHDTGDRVLQMVARTLANCARGADIVARWGGEEFAVIVAGADSEQLREEGMRLSALIAEAGLEYNDHFIRVTVSCGGAAARPEDTMESLFQRADAMMYQSKLDGRNRVSVHAAPIPACAAH